MTRTHRLIRDDFEATRHLDLWIYGHIMEASEPYEMLANPIAVSSGGWAKLLWFPPKGQRKVPQAPGEKIAQLTQLAKAAEIPGIIVPLEETWDRQLRNAVFHSEYCLFGGEVRCPGSGIYSHEQIMTLINQALAYHESFSNLFWSHIRNYEEPQLIDGAYPSCLRLAGAPT